ncbi:MAG TPA: helix-turn-helix transcriptional regulator [Streptosporangiaceae bacterium]|nr:helix-turn-helix transcriptional regulator [Streptosporangiaceae bacterium]
MQTASLADRRHQHLAPDPQPCSCGSGSLTQREVEVLLHSALGMTSEQTGRTLCISPRTVEYHLRMMQQRTGSQNTVQLVARCYANGILQSWPPRWSGRLGPVCHDHELAAVAGKGA